MSASVDTVVQPLSQLWSMNTTLSFGENLQKIFISNSPLQYLITCVKNVAVALYEILHV